MTKRIASSAVVHDSAGIGDNVAIWDLSQIREGAVVGAGSIIGRNAYIDSGVLVGKNCKIQNNALVYYPAVLEDGVFIGPAVVLTNDRYPRAINRDGSIKAASDWDPAAVRVCEGAAIGANSVVLAGVTIGRWALVAMGSVVNRDVPDHGLVAGSPAKLIGYVCYCGQRLPSPDAKRYQTACTRCGEFVEIHEEAE